MSSEKQEQPAKNDKEDLSSESSSDDDDSLVLEGQLVRNPDVSSSSSDDEDEDDEDTKQPSKEEVDSKPAAAAASSPAKNRDRKDETSTSAKRKAPNNKPDKKNKKTKKQRKSENEVDMSYVDFIFCDVHERYWHGLKALLANAGSTLYQGQSSALATAMVDYDMVGTVLAQEADPEHTVYGFGSLVHWAHVAKPTREQITTVCRQTPVTESNKDADAQSSVMRVLSDTTTCRTALLLTGRMINVPLEIVVTLHQQVWQDITWAQTQQTKLSYRDIAAVVRLAPCSRDAANSNSYVYRYFDDEFLAQHAKSAYVVPSPRSYSREDAVYLHVIKLTLSDYRAAIQAMERMVTGGGTS